MEIEVKQGNIAEQATDAIVVNLFQGVTEPSGATGAVDAALNGAIRDLIATGDFSGRAGETAIWYSRGLLPAPRVLVVGLGEREKFNLQAVRNAAATAARKAREVGAQTFATIVHGAGIGGLDPEAAAQATAEGIQLGLYRFRGYKSELPRDWQKDPEVAMLVEQDAQRIELYRRAVARAAVLAKGVMLARDMVNEPANHMTPSTMAGLAQDMAERTGLKAEVLETAEMAELGMGILLAVAAASAESPKFIVLEHNAGREELPTIVLIGKGVTFDSGGISIKPSEDMWRMKGDMAGAAAVIGALGVAASIDLPIHVVGLAPCVENLPGGNAQKPGDVFTGMSGKTMEVISTDAEGRMLLADALAYAERYEPDAVVDIATLTGAQMIALGPQAAAVFSNNDELAQKLLAAGEQTGERLWRLPLYDEYAEPIRSQVADVKNSGSRYAGIGTSAKFLQHFTGDYPWAHIDMASMNMADEDRPFQPKGGTGYGVRVLTAFLESWAK